jgi:hypothetical protein
MSKILHVVREVADRFQIRETDAAGEGSGFGNHTECQDRRELESSLRPAAAPIR